MNGYHFNAESARIDTAWPNLPQLKTLRLENCVLSGEDLIQILSRTTTKLQSLALFAVRHPFRNNELPSFFVDSLEELWIENSGPISFESHFLSYSGLRSLHLDWHLFVKMVAFVPPNLLDISIAVPNYVASRGPNYGWFEAELERTSIVLPQLRVIRVLGQRGYHLLDNEMELLRNLGARGTKLVVELVHRGEGEHSLVLVRAIC